MPKNLSVHSQTAREEVRDQFGKFTSPQPSLPNSPNPPNTPSFFSNLWKNLSKLSLKKITAILAFVSLVATNGISLTIIELFFPHSSPVFHRSVAHQGILKTSGNGQYSLELSDSSVYTLYLKPSPTLNSLKNLNEVVVRGNLTLTPYVIENAEIYPLNISTPNPPNTPNNPDVNLPKLYSKIPWDLEEEKTLVFTSGKRRVDMQGVHLESVQVADFPQDFLDYYTKELTNLNFTKTLNSKNSDGITQSYENNGKYFTFGAKFIFSGSGDKKELVGYKAFIEHN